VRGRRGKERRKRKTHPVLQGKVERRRLDLVVLVGEGGDEFVEDLQEKQDELKGKKKKGKEKLTFSTVNPSIIAFFASTFSSSRSSLSASL
jgi:hypothetical protein